MYNKSISKDMRLAKFVSSHPKHTFHYMASTSASPAPFTFASPISVSSETHEDELDFDYESWIQQSKIANCYSDKQLWMDDAEAEAINRHHQEMMLRVADNLPEEAYELSLRDITELSSLPPPPPAAAPATRDTTTRSLPSRHKSTPSISMDGAGSFIIKLFMPSSSRGAAAASSGGGRRNKSFSSSSTIVSVLRKKSAPANYGRSRSMENDDTHSNGYHDSPKRKPVSCYPLFNSRKYKAKHKFSGNQ